VGRGLRKSTAAPAPDRREIAVAFNMPQRRAKAIHDDAGLGVDHTEKITTQDCI